MPADQRFRAYRTGAPLEEEKLHMKNLRFKKALWMPALLGGLLILAAPNVFPQAETGQIIANVTDPSGAAIPGAKVTVRSIATGAERSAPASDLGTATFTNLLP